MAEGSAPDRLSVLVTGASGMIGANLCHRLAADGHRVAMLLRQSGMPACLAGITGRATIVRADLTDREAVAATVRAAAPDVVFHLASTPFNPPPTSTRHLEVNVLGTDNLMSALAGRSGTRVIHVGSAAQYGDGNDFDETAPERPSTLLGASKTCAAALVHAYGRLSGLCTVELRLFTPYGPWERPGRLIPYTVLRAFHREPVELSGGGAQERDFLHIDDVIDALVRAMTAPVATGCVLNICSGEATPIRAVAALVLDLMGNPVPLNPDARPARPDEIWRMSGSNALAARQLSWSPKVGLEDGLRRTIDWIKASLVVIPKS